MSRWIANTLGIFSICAVCLIGWAAFRIGTLAGTVKAPDLTQTTAKLNQALDTINQPKWGTLAEVDASLKDARLTIDAANKVAIHEQAQIGTIDTYARNLDRELSGLSGSGTRTLDALATTANSATGTLTAAQTDLETANGALNALPPLVRAYTRSGDDLDALLKSPSISGTLANVNLLTNNMNVIAQNGNRVTTKLTNDFMAPRPWYRRVVPGISDIWDFAALAARHTP